MGLEVFDFIPDLVDTNPDPTDPVAQGDDHLRGIKFTLQNQWPAIGSDQVLRTALQMNDAALRTEANTFTADNIFQNDTLFTQPILAGDDSGISFLDEAAVLRWASGRENSTASGDFKINRHDGAGALLDAPLQIDAATGQLFTLDGTAALPQYSFQAQQDGGLFAGVGLVGLAVAGVEQFRVEAAFATFAEPVGGPDGSAANPTWSFNNNFDLGMYRSAADVLGFATLGVERLTLDGNAAEFSQVVQTAAGSLAFPAHSFTGAVGLGMFNSGGDLGFAVGGAERLKVASTSVFTGSVAISSGLTVDSSINSDATTDVVKNITYLRGGSNRWQLRMANDAGDNSFEVRRFNTSGVFQATALRIQTTDGLWVFDLAAIPLADPGIPGALWRSGANFLQVSV